MAGNGRWLVVDTPGILDIYLVNVLFKWVKYNIALSVKKYAMKFMYLWGFLYVLYLCIKAHMF